MSGLSRRSFLRKTGVGAVAGLGGCLGSNSSINEGGNGSSSNPATGTSWVRELDIDAPDSVYQRIRDGVTVRDNGQVEVSPQDLLEYGQLVDESDPWRIYPPQTENSIMANERESAVGRWDSAGPNKLDEFTVSGKFATLLTREGGQIIRADNPEDATLAVGTAYTAADSEKKIYQLKTDIHEDGTVTRFRFCLRRSKRCIQLKTDIHEDGTVTAVGDGPLLDIGPTIGDSDLPEAYITPLFHENEEGEFHALYLAFLDSDYLDHITAVKQANDSPSVNLAWGDSYQERLTLRYGRPFSPVQVTEEVVADAYIQENISQTLTGSTEIDGVDGSYKLEGAGIGYRIPDREEVFPMIFSG